jgi:N6-L-threonylcarbamoyladenine synthase
LRILGIESSCDETAAAVVADGRRILSSIVASQMQTHGKYGGVVPELASREHLRAIVPVVRESMERAGCSWDGLSAVGVTEGPGLVGSLLVGITFAKAICISHRLPLVAVNHIEGHIHAVMMDTLGEVDSVEFPAVALVASGGHTHLFEVLPGMRYQLLGKTRDDAAGEAFDKVAKLLGFGYPGGPVIDRLAPHGDARAVRFSTVRMKGNPLDFSFSGLKTAVLRWVESHDLAEEIEARRQLLQGNPNPATSQWLEVTPQRTLDLLASFQHAVVDQLLGRTQVAAAQIGAASVIISGGVACNTELRKAARLDCPVHFPTPALSTDNAAMIAAAAFSKLAQGKTAGWDLRAQAGLTLA